MYTSLLKPPQASRSIPQAFPKPSPSLPQPPRSIPKQSPSPPKHSHKQNCDMECVRVCVCVGVCVCVCVCVCVLPSLGLSGPLWASASQPARLKPLVKTYYKHTYTHKACLHKASHRHWSLMYIHTYVHIGPIYIWAHTHICKPFGAHMWAHVHTHIHTYIHTYIHKPPGAHIRLLGYV